MPLPFSGNPLFSSDDLRQDEIELKKLKCRKDALFLPYFKYDPATTESGDFFWIPWSTVQSVASNPDGAIFLGLTEDGSPRFAIDIGDSLEYWNHFTSSITQHWQTR